MNLVGIPWENSRASYFHISIDRSMIPLIGIYKIQNKINGKVYIGQSNHIEKRFRQHCYSINRAHGRSIVDYDIEKYGKENFDFSII